MVSPAAVRLPFPAACPPPVTPLYISFRYFVVCVFVIDAAIRKGNVDYYNNSNNNDNNDVYADNTTVIVVSSVVGAIALIALIFLFQFIR